MYASEQIGNIKPQLCSIVAGALLAGLTAAAPAAAQETSFAPDQFAITIDPVVVASAEPAPWAADNDLHFVWRTGLWAMGMNGTLSFGDRSTDFKADFSDLIENLNFGLMPGFELIKGKWVVAFNGVFSQLEMDNSKSRTRLNGQVVERGADVEIDMYVADLAAGYRLLDIPLGSDKQSMLSIIPAAGVRYTYFDQSVNPRNFATRSANTELWDPYIGGRINLQITKTLAWRNDGSIGGFGVGSKFAWSAQSMLDWRFSKHFELNVGYRAMYYDYEDGNLELDLTLHGPWFGLSIYFD